MKDERDSMIEAAKEFAAKHYLQQLNYPSTRAWLLMADFALARTADLTAENSRPAQANESLESQLAQAEGYVSDLQTENAALRSERDELRNRLNGVTKEKP